MRTNIERFLENFPKNATNWSQATDEVRDMARKARELLEEYEGVIVEPVNFRAIETPAEWNTEGREFILTNFDRMADRTKERFYAYFRNWFEGEEESADIRCSPFKLRGASVLTPKQGYSHLFR